MTTTTINPVQQPAELGDQTSSSRPHRVWMMLDVQTGDLWCDTDWATGSTPADVVYGRHLRWAMPPLTADAANRLMAEVAPLAQRIIDGTNSEWRPDLWRFVRTHTPDSQAAQGIGALTDPDQDWPVEDLVQVWAAADWLRTDCTDLTAEVGLTAATTDEDVDRIGGEVLAGAQQHGVIVIPDLTAHLSDAREELRIRRDEVCEALNAYPDDNLWEDVIYQMPGYDEAATDRAYEELERNRDWADVAVIGGVTYRWDERTREWSY